MLLQQWRTVAAVPVPVAVAVPEAAPKAAPKPAAATCASEGECSCLARKKCCGADQIAAQQHTTSTRHRAVCISPRPSGFASAMSMRRLRPISSCTGTIPSLSA